MGGPEMAPKPHEGPERPGKAVTLELVRWGAPRWPPPRPPTSGASRRSRDAPLSPVPGLRGFSRVRRCLFRRAGAVFGDAGGPARALLEGHVALRGQAWVRVVPVLAVDQVLGPLDE